ncbi:hypothetical protein NUU61_006819 [Penicillium alfredii]|uniref:Uncharacterized protein n=1 Tax=Penicillium alfredii TaxID=1506179 RepID=A0A9W9K3Q1_9EURO|nr:uncharacterized protein NUU61_006819 [Penicillium alfredii]KAJ5091949.1 hypothetical protein NUU61_006819 [Penicillium alfredii]
MQGTLGNTTIQPLSDLVSTIVAPDFINEINTLLKDLPPLLGPDIIQPLIKLLKEVLTPKLLKQISSLIDDLPDLIKGVISLVKSLEDWIKDILTPESIDEPLGDAAKSIFADEFIDDIRNFLKNLPPILCDFLPLLSSNILKPLGNLFSIIHLR